MPTDPTAVKASAEHHTDLVYAIARDAARPVPAADDQSQLTGNTPRSPTSAHASRRDRHRHDQVASTKPNTSWPSMDVMVLDAGHDYPDRRAKGQ